MEPNLFLTFATGALLILNGLFSRGREIDPNELTAGVPDAAEEAERSPDSVGRALDIPVDAAESPLSRV